MQEIPGKCGERYLGDVVEAALVRIGVTSEAVSRWLGECGCRERKERLNALDAWARRIVGGRIERAREYLRTLVSE